MLHSGRVDMGTRDMDGSLVEGLVILLGSQREWQRGKRHVGIVKDQHEEFGM